MFSNNCIEKFVKKNSSRKNTLSSGKIVVAKYSGKKEIRKTITFMKYVNQLVMNAAQQMRLTIKNKNIIVEKGDFIIKKDMKLKEMKR